MNKFRQKHKARNINNKKNIMSPYLLILLSFVFIILIGSVLFVLPIATNGENLTYIDALMLSFSSVTITGLNPINNLGTTLSIFGKVVLTILIQLGGLGVITFGVFIMVMLGAKIGINERMLLKENLNNTGIGGVVSLLKKIVLFTFTLELLGFFVNLIIFLPRFEVLPALGYSIFHAISSFNNAGITLFTDAELVSYASSSLYMISTSIMVILGGLGFVFISEIYRKKRIKNLSMHAKIVLSMNFILWFSGALFIFLGELKDTRISFFQAMYISINSRTAGFNHYDLLTLKETSLLIIFVLMFIGGAPSSSAGGLKVTTFYTLIKTLTSFAKGKQPTGFKRKIAAISQQKALVLLISYIIIVITGSFLILLFDDFEFSKVSFVMTGAITNTGLTTLDITTLSSGSKLVLMISMLIGRVGPLSLITLINTNWYKPPSHSFSYLEERVIIG